MLERAEFVEKALVARRDEKRATRPESIKGADVLQFPDVVEHQQARAVGQQFAQPGATVALVKAFAQDEIFGQLMSQVNARKPE